jgi:hypothetical protein
MYLVGITLFSPNSGWNVLPCLRRREGRTARPLSVISHCNITDCEVLVAVHRGAISQPVISGNTEKAPAATETMNGTFTFSPPRLLDHAIATCTAIADATVGATRRSIADFPHSNVGTDGAGRPRHTHDGRIRSRRAPPGAVRS